MSSGRDGPARAGAGARRFGGWLLRWAAALGAIFALGIIATWVVQVGPRTREITRLRSDLETATRERAEAQAEVARLRPMEDALDRSEKRVLVLQASLDVARSQTALARGDEAAARQALRQTASRLTTLEGALGPDQADRVSSMRDRLNLVLSEIDQDPFAAQNDLEVLGASLAALERELAQPPP